MKIFNSRYTRALLGLTFLLPLSVHAAKENVSPLAPQPTTCITSSFNMECSYTFSRVPGVFYDHTKGAEDNPSSPTPIATQDQLGIIQDCEYDTKPLPPDSQSQWQRLENHVTHLNKHGGSNESYKVIYVVRHGDSVHNAVMRAVGGQWKV